MNNDQNLYSLNLNERIAAHLRNGRELIDECVRSTGGDPNLFVDKAIPQSELFMAELIPIIHKYYLSLPTNASKTVLDVGPQSFGGTALLANLHTEKSFCKLKLNVTAIDITDRFCLIKDLIAPDVEFIVKDIFEIENRTWDFVICSHVIEHVDRPDIFLRRLQNLSKDFVLVACPWLEYPLTTKGHINTIDENFVRLVGGIDLNTYINYNWGKNRKVCSFWLPGLA